MMKKRTTVYLDEKIIKLLKIRSIQTDQSVSDYINKLVYYDISQEQKDLKDVKIMNTNGKNVIMTNKNRRPMPKNLGTDK